MQRLKSMVMRNGRGCNDNGTKDRCSSQNTVRKRERFEKHVLYLLPAQATRKPSTARGFALVPNISSVCNSPPGNLSQSSTVELHYELSSHTFSMELSDLFR